MTTTIKDVIDRLYSGHCWRTFSKIMPKTVRRDTVLKTAAAAIVAKIIMTSLNATALQAFNISAVVGISVFAYITASYSPADFVGDHLREGVNGMVNSFKRNR